jgi:hypothetical protein
MARFFCLVLACARVASADPAFDQDRALGEAPDPAGPTFEVGWRDGLRGEAGARIPIVRRDDRFGFALELPAFIELHNDRPGPVPYQNWRGHIGLVAATRWRAGDATVRAFGALEHESDHDLSAHWIYYEAVGGGAAATVDTTIARLTVAAQVRLLFETCTLSIACTNADGLGDTSVQGTLAVVVDAMPSRSDRPFAALYADATAANGQVAGEARAIAHAGYALDAGARGVWQFFAQALVGREVGIDSIAGYHVHAGLGIRWEP